MKQSLIEQIADIHNLKKALDGLNHGSCAGLDGVSMEMLEKRFPDIAEQISKDILNGRYHPLGVLRIYVPKRSGADFRMLSIPSTQDRMIQASMVNVLSPIFNDVFSDNSYGFIKGRGCFPALYYVLQKVNQGKTKVVNIDLKKFFDRVPHDKLLEVLQKYITEEKLMVLIKQYLKASGYERGKGSFCVEKGVPQGGPLSPLLGNVILNELDNYLEDNGIPFARYADDCIILCGGEREAVCVFDKVSTYIEDILHLDINYEKSSIADIKDIEYLGYGFKLNNKGRYVFDVKEERFEDLKNRVFQVIHNYYGIVPNKEFVTRVMWITRGWVNYYALADIRAALQEFDQWFQDTISEIHQNKVSKYNAEINALVNIGIKYNQARRMTNQTNFIDNSPVLTIDVNPTYYYQNLRLCGYQYAEELYDSIRQKWKLNGKGNDYVYKKNCN